MFVYTDKDRNRSKEDELKADKTNGDILYPQTTDPCNQQETPF